MDPVAGGTGLTSYAVGDLPYASAVDTLAKLPIGSAGEVLQVVSGNVSWETDIAGVSGGRTIYGGTTGGQHLVLMPEPGGQGRVYIGDDSSSSGGTYYNGVSSRWRWTIGTANPGDGMQDHTFILAPDDGNSAVDPGDGIRFEFRGVNSVVTEYEMGFLEFEVVDSTSGSETSVARIGVSDGSTAVAQIEIEPGLITIPEGDLVLTSGNVEITDGDLTVAGALDLIAGVWKIGGTLVTPTVTEINRLAGVTSGVQTQLDAAVNLLSAGRLEYQSATQLRLNAWAGQYLDVGGEIQTVDGSTAGCQLAPTDNLISSSGTDAGAAMAANTTYYVYRSNSTASFAASDLRASATAPTDFRGDKYLAASGNGAKWRFVGMVRTNGSTQFTNNLLVISWLNRRLRRVVSKDTTDSWTYTTGSWRGANNGNSAWKVDFLANGVDVARATAKSQIVSTSGHARFAIGLSSTSAPDGDCLYESGGASNGHVDTFYLGVPAIGYQYLQALEFGTTGANFYGDNGGVSVGGIFVEVMG